MVDSTLINPWLFEITPQTLRGDCVEFLQIQRLFIYPKRDAAKSFGMSERSFRTLCARCGVTSWPRRRFLKLKRQHERAGGWCTHQSNSLERFRLERLIECLLIDPTSRVDECNASCDSR